MRLVAFLSLMSIVVAGCGDDPQSDAQTDDVFSGLEDAATVTATTGAIAGVVVDEAIRPVANANVTLLSSGAVSSTDNEGRFTFEGLDAGTYFLSAEAHRFEKAQVSADILAGEVATVRILITRMTSAEPYHLTQQFRGHIDAYLGTASFAVQLLAPGTVNCICEWTIFPDAANLTTVVYEALGTTQVSNPDTPATKGGDAYWELWEQEGDGAGHTAYDFYPIVEHLSLEDSTAPFQVRITGGAYVTGSMNYDLYVTLFYREEAPEDWSLINGSV